MGRRKKEPRSVHRENIVSAASALFLEKGIAAASMDDIAKAAGYSKATLYVYFENKEEIDLNKLSGTSDMKKIQDLKGNPLLLFINQWSIGMTVDRNKGLVLSEFGRN